jgi:hypothetical protein
MHISLVTTKSISIGGVLAPVILAMVGVNFDRCGRKR